MSWMEARRSFCWSSVMVARRGGAADDVVLFVGEVVVVRRSASEPVVVAGISRGPLFMTVVCVCAYNMIWSKADRRRNVNSMILDQMSNGVCLGLFGSLCRISSSLIVCHLWMPSISSCNFVAPTANTPYLATRKSIPIRLRL